MQQQVLCKPDHPRPKGELLPCLCSATPTATAEHATLTLGVGSSPQRSRLLGQPDCPQS